jgi:tRNA nucleotidyltransferase (CCA-adding enzyme)
MSIPAEPREDLAAALAQAYPELARVREVAIEPIFLVGGAVRDLLLGRDRADLDLVIEGDAARLATVLGGDVLAHKRFGTAAVQLAGHWIDVATARSEVYPSPGALPHINPSSLSDDLSRRDFTINAIAISLDEEPRLIDPWGGRSDLDAGLLRVLHPGSFIDDPTRALRAARYAARFDFALESETAELVKRTDLNTISADRRRAELLRIAAESEPIRGFELALRWGLVESQTGGLELAAAVWRLVDQPPWRGVVQTDRVLLAALLGPLGSARQLASARPERPSRAVELARGHSPIELALGRALGAKWLDLYLTRWRAVSLEIDGNDLIAAGLSQGPELGRGLDQALRLKLDGEIEGREQELAAALAAAEAR